MRNIFLFLAIIGMSTACKKEAGEEIDGEGLEGKWALRQTLVSPGPIGEWKNYKGPLVSYTFRSDSSMESSASPQYDRYAVNGNSITFYQNTSSDSLRRSFKLDKNELIIWGPCFEPCGSKYRRVK